ncbi:hypothetical protein [Cerasicoccus maritimus]|uniref:hypothetical protein n=1 Tax=Cerasicoccus maritimus TaxID=490089 RepID=UPI002852D6E7|nr:hypothetical protein [Cerasicoccus maritimus]
MNAKEANAIARCHLGPRGVAVRRRDDGMCVVGFLRDALTVEPLGVGKGWKSAWRDALGSNPNPDELKTRNS